MNESRGAGNTSQCSGTVYSMQEQLKSFATVWLDIANAYGSIPHAQIFLALERYGVSQSWIRLIQSYYGGLWSKSFVENASSSWHRHDRGIFAGCCVSIILFLLGMNIIIEYIINAGVTQFLNSQSVSVPPVKAFMDDLNFMTVTTNDIIIIIKQ